MTVCLQSSFACPETRRTSRERLQSACVLVCLRVCAFVGQTYRFWFQLKLHHDPPHGPIGYVQDSVHKGETYSTVPGPGLEEYLGLGARNSNAPGFITDSRHRLSLPCSIFTVHTKVNPKQQSSHSHETKWELSGLWSGSSARFLWLEPGLDFSRGIVVHLQTVMI